MMKCKICGEEIPESVGKCTYCNTGIPEEQIGIPRYTPEYIQ